METTRNLKDGTITVRASSFVVHVSEDSVRVLIADTVVHEWKLGPKHNDAPSPRSRPVARKRGAR